MTAEHFACGVVCHICSWAKLWLLSADEILSVIQCDFQFKLKLLLSHLPFSPIISPTIVFFFIRPGEHSEHVLRASHGIRQCLTGLSACMEPFTPRVGSSAKLVWSSMKKFSMCLSVAGWSAHRRLPGCLQGSCVFEKAVALATGLSVHSHDKIKTKSPETVVTIEGRDVSHC